MNNWLTSFVLVLSLSFSLSLPAFAADDSNYYSLLPVGGSVPSLAIDWPVATTVSHDGFLAEDSENLYRIMIDLTTSGMNTVKTYIADIRDSLSRGGSVYAFLSSIENTLTSQNVHGSLAWFVKHINSSLTSIDANLSSLSGVFNGQGLATESTLSNVSSALNTFSSNPEWSSTGTSSLASYLSRTFGVTSNNFNESGSLSDAFPYNVWGYSLDGTMWCRPMSWSGILSNLALGLTFDGKTQNGYTGDYTLYHFVKNLSDTLASEDDKQLAQNQKENRDQAQNDFLTGQSGPTSLGKGDFSNASQVGGALNDTFNMGGAAKVSDFLSGFVSAGSESQAWFSQTTSNNLNAVEASDGTSGVSTFADDGETMIDVDPDPYNMGNIFERYDWIEGVNIDD